MTSIVLSIIATALIIGSFYLFGARPLGFGVSMLLGLLCLVTGILMMRRADPPDKSAPEEPKPETTTQEPPKPNTSTPDVPKPAVPKPTVSISVSRSDSSDEPIYCYPRVHIAGTRYHEAAADLMVGDELEVIPDPDNEHDPDAVGVYRADDGELVGFIHRDSRHKQMVLDYYPRDDWRIEAEVSDVVDESNIYMELRFYRL